MNEIEKHVDHEPGREPFDRFTVIVHMPEKWNTLYGYRFAVSKFASAGVPDHANVQIGYPTAYASWDTQS